MARPDPKQSPAMALPRSAPRVGIARRNGLGFAARFADPPRRWYPEHGLIALIWLGSVALGLWRIHAGL